MSGSTEDSEPGVRRQKMIRYEARCNIRQEPCDLVHLNRSYATTGRYLTSMFELFNIEVAGLRQVQHVET